MQVINVVSVWSYICIYYYIIIIINDIIIIIIIIIIITRLDNTRWWTLNFLEECWQLSN